LISSGGLRLMSSFFSIADCLLPSPSQ